MIVEVQMENEDKFHVNRWWASDPVFVIDALKKQLKAAQSIWPILEAYEISPIATSPVPAGEAA